MNLASGEQNYNYLIDEIVTADFEIEKFLFSLGCFPGEQITIISKLASNYIVCIKDSRYSIDTDLANCIIIK